MARFDTCENKMLNSQLAQVATAVPMERVLVGKTSDASTQDTGPKDSENMTEVMKIMAIPARWASLCGLG